jgi:hypothetical protein
MKKGDIVKCIAPDSGIVVGNYYTIDREGYYGEVVVYLTPDGPPYYKEQFEVFNIKKGDKVIAITSRFDLTEGKTYDVIEVPYLYKVGSREMRIVIMDDKERYEYSSNWFEKVSNVTKSIDELISIAKSYIGKTVESDGERFKVSDIDVYVSKTRATSSSTLVFDYFQKNGFCVAVVGEYFTIPVDQVVLAKDSIEVPLNDTYNANVYKDKIVVGCQTFPISILDELVAAHNSL